MSTAKYNGAWRAGIAAIQVKQGGVWVDHTELYARSESDWHLVDLNAEQLDPAYHIWKAYAKDPDGVDLLSMDISLTPSADRPYLGLLYKQRKELTDVNQITYEIAQIFDWTLVESQDLDVQLVSDNGFLFRNGSGPVKTITAEVYHNGAKLTDVSDCLFTWKTGGSTIYINVSNEYTGTSPGTGLSPADGTDDVTPGINTQSIIIDPSDVIGSELYLACSVVKTV